MNKDLIRKLQSIRRPVWSGKRNCEFDDANYSSVRPTKVAVKADAGHDDYTKNTEAKASPSEY